MREQLRGRTVVAGHSLGATVALRAALHRSDLFSALILIDPVIVPKPAMLFWASVHALRLTSVLQPLVRSACRRRSSFHSIEDIFKSYRERAVFRYFDDDNLSACISGLVRAAKDGGYRLLYAPEWEARVYESAVWNDWDLWKGISGLGMPTLIIRGVESGTFGRQTARALARRNPGIRIAEVERASHLVPLERPRETALACKLFLEDGKAKRRYRRPPDDCETR
jgi:pimeloyl-ACP methyl ester carboxylesterase